MGPLEASGTLGGRAMASRAAWQEVAGSEQGGGPGGRPRRGPRACTGGPLEEAPSPFDGVRVVGVAAQSLLSFQGYCCASRSVGATSMPASPSPQRARSKSKPTRYVCVTVFSASSMNADELLVIAMSVPGATRCKSCLVSNAGKLMLTFLLLARE
eukprot:CAMPEP_0183585848 /NCGR_PEP_ID=MMETSP0371-20130417/156094_1 /TAXON_ID=268820 /ORGANISM="Peridinium aciculiferum, Strain PAER-2" /LENGTH=155 /DNA_ID=CAMNT_0025796863 /DNA_START=3 /DNA_END=471 /DNA_ORIENTATION=-